MDSDEIVLNPHAKIIRPLKGETSPDRQLASTDGLVVQVPLRGRPLARHRIEKGADGELFDLFCKIRDADGDLELDLTDAQEEYLLRIGFLAPKREIPETIRYRCFLDGDDLAELSGRASPFAVPPCDRLIVDPSLLFEESGAVPEPLRDRVLSPSCFLSGYPILWVEDPGTSVLAPYWVRGRQIDIARSLRPGAPAPANLDPETERCFRAAGILAPDDRRERRAAEVRRALDEARAGHAERRYAALVDLIPPPHIAAMRRYYRRMIENGHVPFDDGQVRKRYYMHEEPLAMVWHRQLARVISHVTGRAVKPSYCYFAQYEPGAVLQRHTDRAQAEYTLSIQIAYEPEIGLGEKTPWPIFVETKGKEGLEHAEHANRAEPTEPSEPAGSPNPDAAEIRLAIGEAALYRGCELPHYRNELPADNRSISVFFHYVHAEFEGSLR
jgi:hypothetical protein